MWLENLVELKKKTGMSTKQIAEKTNLPERTVARIFSGETDNPYVDTLHRIVTVLDGSLDDILADTKVVVATESLVEVKETLAVVEETLAEVEGTANVMEAERDLVKIENERLRVENTNMATELKLLKMELQHKDELLAIHNYYKSVISGMTK